MTLYRAEKDTLDFQPIKLPFVPILVSAEKDGLYIAERGKKVKGKIFYQLHYCIPQADGTLSSSPIENVGGLEFQHCGDKLLFTKTVELEGMSGLALYAYDMETKRTEKIKDLIGVFYVLNDHTICVADMGLNFSLIDLSSGKVTAIPYPEDNK